MKHSRSIFFLLCALIFTAVLCGAGTNKATNQQNTKAASTENSDYIAKAVHATEGSFIVRGSKKMPLAENIAIKKYDTITTDRLGNATLNFEDGMIIELSPNTNLDIYGYYPIGGEVSPDVTLKLYRGEVKVTTGKIAEHHIASFSLSTPIARIWAQRATFTVFTKDEITSVQALKLTPKSDLIVRNFTTTMQTNINKEGQKLDCTPQKDIIK